MISGYFDSERPPHPYLNVAIWIEGIAEEWVLVPFLVDTGASVTAIHALDAVRRLGMTPADLDPEAWRATASFSGVGGSAKYLTRAAHYGFYHDSGEWQIIRGEVRIGDLSTSRNGLPSLLGWDFLQWFELSLHGRNGTVSLERV